MPRLPDITDLGSRPTPVSRRQIASNPRAGAVGQALEGFGETVGRIGEGIAENEARLATAAAKSAILKADVATRQELQDDPDYETWGTRYAEKMKAVREQAAKSIPGKQARTLFDADAELDIARGSAQLGQIAQGRRSSARTALGLGAADAAEDAAVNATDDQTRAAGLANMNTAIQALVDRGDISAVEGYDQRTKRTQRYLGRRFDSLMNLEDYDGAQGLLDANRDKLDTDAEGRFEQRLVDAKRTRETLGLAEEFVNGGGAVTVSSGSSSPTPAPSSIGRMVAITAQSESGNRERDGNGRLVTSSAGAQGKMQVMPGTARNPGYGIKPWDGRTDEDRSRVGRELLAALIERHGGDAAKAWASYNWDSSGNKVDALVRKYGADWLDHAPAETKAYVRKNVAQLGDSGATVQQGPQRHDLNDIYARIDVRAKQEDWTPEKTERVKAQSARLVERDETLLKRQEDDAFDRAIAKANTLGNGFTDVSQLGDAYYRASPADQMRLKGMAEANVKASIAPPPSNGPKQIELNTMSFYEPEKFKALNLGQFMGQITPAEMDSLMVKQAQMRTAAPTAFNPSSGITSAISYGQNIGGLKLNDRDKSAVMQIMEDEANALHSAGKPVDYNALYKSATRNVVTTKSTFGFSSQGSKPRYQLQGSNIPTGVRERIVSTWKRERGGQEPTEDDIVRIYRATTR